MKAGSLQKIVSIIFEKNKECSSVELHSLFWLAENFNPYQSFFKNVQITIRRVPKNMNISDKLKMICLILFMGRLK